MRVKAQLGCNLADLSATRASQAAVSGEQRRTACDWRGLHRRAPRPLLAELLLTAGMIINQDLAPPTVWSSHDRPSPVIPTRSDAASVHGEQQVVHVHG